MAFIFVNIVKWQTTCDFEISHYRRAVFTRTFLILIPAAGGSGKSSAGLKYAGLFELFLK